MRFKKLSCLVIFLFINSPVFSETKGYPCSNPGVMELTDRGTLTDTPCIVPEKQLLIEGGYQHQELITPESLAAYPQTQIVYGLPYKTEVFVDIPNYNKPSNASHSGFGATTVGAKHEVAYGKKWAVSLQGILTIPSGSEAFGSPKIGAVVNGIFALELVPQWVLAGMFGSSLTADSREAGGQYFNSYNPSISLLYNPFETINLFIELFGQTKTAAAKQSGFFTDTGLIYKVNEKATIDFEFSQRIQGNLGDINQYIGVGLTVLI